LARSVKVFNNDDSVAFQERRNISGLAYELLIHAVAPEIDRRLGLEFAHPVRILDVGCGSGPWIEAILKHADPSLPLRVKGIDPAQRLIDSARQRLKQYPNVELESCAFQDLASAQSFDLIYFVDVIQHFDKRDYEPVFSKSHALLAEGGTIVIIDKEKYSIYSLKMLVKRKLYNLPSYYHTAEYPSFRVLRRLGFKQGLVLDNQFRKSQFACLIMSKQT
jgi:ubiquinone/menaquinone biosynthesis C-methylase UbiE